MTDTSDARPDRVEFGSTGLSVSPVCIGTSPLASSARIYGYEVPAEQAIATVRAALASSVNFMDTSNGYGDDGEGEKRIGEAIRRAGGLPDGFVLATKVDPDPRTKDFSGARVRRSLEESLERLGLDRIPLLSIHDPERTTFAEAAVPGGLIDAMVELKEEGLVANIGVAGGPVGVLQEYVDTGAFDYVLTHNRYSLVDQSAAEFFQAAHEAGLGTLNAAPYGGGMLVKGPDVQPNYAYRQRDAAITASVRAMATACEGAKVPLAAAALQFAIKPDFIDAVVVGVSSPRRVSETLALLEFAVSDTLLQQLEDLAPGRDVWLP